MTNLSPKARFLAQTDKARKWADLTGSDEFQEAVGTALLELLHQTQSGPVYEAQAASHRLDGAKRFARLLCNLGEKEVPPQQVKTPALEHEDFGVPEHLKPQSLET